MNKTTSFPDVESEGFLDAIRGGFAFVAERARHVRIAYDRLNDYARFLPEQPPANLFDNAHHFFGTPEETAACTLILNAVNFGSGYKDDMEAEGFPIVDNSIYYSISTPLKRFFEKERNIPASVLAVMSPVDVARMLGLPETRPACMEFATLAAHTMNEFGALIEAEHQGSYIGFVDSMDGSAEKLAASLARLSSFRDEHMYRGRMIPIYKRAQIAAGELHLAFQRIRIKLFNDIHRLTMYPDNGVPHVLRMDGILEYTPELAGRIDGGELIASGSEEEIELRCCAGHAVELIAARKGMTAADIDYRLWHRSIEGDKYQTLPAHRTKSVYY